MTTTDTLTLSKNDLKALRQADTISFLHRDGKAYIQASKRTKNPGPFDPYDVTYRIDVEKSYFRGYYESEKINPENASCYYNVSTCCQYSEEWQTIAHFLKEGDTLTLDWRANGAANQFLKAAKVVGPVGDNNSYEGASFCADMLYLKVKRGEKNFTFLIGVDVTLQSSSFRMCRVK